MNKIILILLFAIFSTQGFSQNKEEAEKLVNDGVILHDKGNYPGAISKYDEALTLDKDNLNALAEKSFSLFSMKKYEESIKCCQKVLEAHSGEKELKMVFVTYGNALDALGKHEKSLEVYNEGIKQFPDFYMLYYNKGVTLSGLEKYEEAVLSFQHSVMANPNHASSHNAIAGLAKYQGMKVPALLASCRFLVIEPEGKRAKETMEYIKKTLYVGKKKKGKSNSIYVSPDMFSDSTKDGKQKENSFSGTEMCLAMFQVIDLDKILGITTDQGQLADRMKNVCKSLKESKKNNYGFYWDYYAPYFTEMFDNEMTRTFAYLALASSGKSSVKSWIETHSEEVQEFYQWSDSYEWIKK